MMFELPLPAPPEEPSFLSFCFVRPLGAAFVGFEAVLPVRFGV
jgi:hypothetical protein